MIHGMPTKHPLRFVQSHGKLVEALGLSESEITMVTDLVNQAVDEDWNMKRLFGAVGELEISDEAWANFLYTYGWWDAERRL